MSHYHSTWRSRSSREEVDPRQPLSGLIFCTLAHVCFWHLVDMSGLIWLTEQSSGCAASDRQLLGERHQGLAQRRAGLRAKNGCACPFRKLPARPLGLIIDVHGMADLMCPPGSSLCCSKELKAAEDFPDNFQLAERNFFGCMIGVVGNNFYPRWPRRIQ